MKWSIKQAILEIKDIVFKKENIDLEGYLEVIAKKSDLTYEDLVEAYNAIALWEMDEQKGLLAPNKRKTWSKGENQLISFYMEHGVLEIDSNTGRNKSRNVLFKELEEILNDRTAGSAQFQFYTNINNEKEEQPKELVPLQEVHEEKTETTNEFQKEKQDDLLDMVVTFVENVDEVGMDVTPFFKGMLALSQRAVENNKTKIEELEGKVIFYKQELENEKEKNDNLQLQVLQLISDFEELKKEISYFDNLDGKRKLQQLHNYNKKLKYMVDKFGGVITVGMG